MKPNDSNTIDIPVPDASTTQEDLNAKIDAELGLKPTITNEETPKSDETTEAKNTDTTVTDDSSEEQTSEETSENTEEVEQPKAPTEAATPSDEELFIEVVDAEGVTHKISTIDDLPEDFTPKNNRQILEIIRATDNLDKQREQREAEATTAAEQTALAETQQAQFKSWDNEIAELAKTKRITMTDTDRVNDIFGYMNEVNGARIKVGNPNLISSFEDALDKFEAKEAIEAAESGKKNDNELAKIKSSLIGRSSSASSGDKYVYRAGSARNIDDIPL